VYIFVKIIYIFVRQDYKKLLVNQVSQGDFLGKYVPNGHDHP